MAESSTAAADAMAARQERLRKISLLSVRIYVSELFFWFVIVIKIRWSRNLEPYYPKITSRGCPNIVIYNLLLVSRVNWRLLIKIDVLLGITQASVIPKKHLFL